MLLDKSGLRKKSKGSQQTNSNQGILVGKNKDGNVTKASSKEELNDVLSKFTEAYKNGQLK